MSLSDWQKNGWLKLHKADEGEIADLLAVVERDLHDSNASGLSEDWQFNIAYNAALQSASVALQASGFTVPKGESSHFRLFQSLEHTIGLDSKMVGTLDTYRKKRSMSVYDRAGAISSAEAKEMGRLAQELLQRVMKWLKANHPDLIP